MNVRERAKNYEAFMSKSSSMEREKKRSREETIEKSGPAMNDKKKLVEGGKPKPVPPPRKKKLLDKPDRSPQLQHRSAVSIQVKSPPDVQARPVPSKTPTAPSSDGEKPKTPKKPPPPRPAPYRTVSSPSLARKAPQALPRTVPKKPAQITQTTPHTSSPDIPKPARKDIPKRPPPPAKTSSLPRKPKPPVPPKPKIPLKPTFGAQKERSATLPKTGSLKPKETKSEENIHVETKAERSLTGPNRVSQEKEDVSKTMDDKPRTVENGTTDFGADEKETSHLVSGKADENIIKQTPGGNTESEEDKETQELQSQNESMAANLSKNGEDSNIVSQEDETRTLNNGILKEDKEPQTVLDEEIITNEKIELNTNDIIRSEKNFTENPPENDRNVTVDDHSERVLDVEDEGKNEVANEPSQSVSVEGMDNNLTGDQRIGDMCKKPPLAENLDKEIEGKLESPEEKAVDAKGITDLPYEDVGLEMENEQSLSHGNATCLSQQNEPSEENTSVDMMAEDSTKEICETNNEAEVSMSPLVDDKTMLVDDAVNSIEIPMENALVESEEEAVQVNDKTEVSSSPLVEDRTVSEEDVVNSIGVPAEQAPVKMEEDSEQVNDETEVSSSPLVDDRTVIEENVVNSIEVPAEHIPVEMEDVTERVNDEAEVGRTPLVDDRTVSEEDVVNSIDVSAEQAPVKMEEDSEQVNDETEVSSLPLIDDRTVSEEDVVNSIDVSAEQAPVKMEEDSEQVNDETEVSSLPLIDDRTVSEEDVVNSIDDPAEQAPVEKEDDSEQVNKEVYADDMSSLSEVTTVDVENSGEQVRPEVIADVEDRDDVGDTRENMFQQTNIDAVLEAIAAESEKPIDEVKPYQEDAGLEEDALEKEVKNVVDVEKDVTKEDEQCHVEIKNEEINENEGMEKTIVEQNKEELEVLNEISMNQASEEMEEDVGLPQEEMKEAPLEEKFPGQTLEDSIEEMQGEAELRDISSEQDISITTDPENPSFTEDILRDKRTEIIVEEQAGPEEILDGVFENQEKVESSKTEVDVAQKNDFFALDEPIRPRRPSRLKKLAKNNTSINNETTEAIKPATETQNEESCKTQELQSKSVAPYENVTLDVSSMKDVQDDENFKLPDPSQESEQLRPQKLTSGYENVVLRTEDNTSDERPDDESPGIYEVPRRSSFHSHTSEEKISCKTRSSSIGSLERNSESEYKVPKPRSKTVAEETYVVPKSNRPYAKSPETEEIMYVVPKAIRGAPSTPTSDSEYHVPRSLLREESTEAEYQVPPRRTPSMDGSEEEEGVYSVPSSSFTVPRQSRAREPSGSEEEEGVYSVPKSPVSVPKGTRVEKDRESQYSECDEENVYSVPNSPAAKETETSSDVTDVEDRRLKRSSRSNVLTSRKQLPESFKQAPPKPPRSSIKLHTKREYKDGKTPEKNASSRPVPIPRTNVPAAKQSPELKPRETKHDENDSYTENIEEELPAPSPPKDQSQSSSPKPKRPAPPRPKAPAVSPLIAKKEGATPNSEEKRHSAPPRPPPPSANRTSLAQSEPESVSSIPGFPSESSGSESEEEDKPPEPTGPPKKKTCFIAHEILSTEKTFVNALKLCCEDCYSLISNANVVPEATLNVIFKDLGNIYHLDCKFLQELEERMKTWDEHERIGDIVRKYGHFLKMYTTYIKNYDRAMNVLQETTKENPQFAELVQQFQASEKCKGLFLISFMLKPVQRIPSYRLLLKDYLKHLPPDSEEFKDIQVALAIVSEVATHINESMKKADNFERVLRIQESIVGNAEIVKPGRDLIKEGVLEKLCRKDMQERMFFLLTDVLLYTTPVGNTQYKLKEELPLLGMKVTVPESPDFENEFSIISKMRSFTLSASTSAERDEWIEELNGAINAMTDKKKTFLKPRDGSIVNTEVEEESKLGEKAPVWIQDVRVTMCMLCTENFTVTNRRHHCRGCGKVVCGSCSDNLAPLAYLDYAQARVCDVCYDFLLKEQNKSEGSNDMERLPASPLGMTSEDLERIHRKPPKFEILHRFKPGSKVHRRKSKAFGRPSVCTEVVGHESGSQMSGFLKYKRTNKHAWKRLWFVLKDNVLYTYKASEDVVAIETIPVLGYSVQEATRTEDEIQFQLKHRGLPPITFKTESETSVARWIQELKKATTL